MLLRKAKDCATAPSSMSLECAPGHLMFSGDP